MTENPSDIQHVSQADLLPTFRIRRPSGNYEKNTGTFAYRLSELVFGSLLASYVLGFVAFVASYAEPAQPGEKAFPVHAIGVFSRIKTMEDFLVVSQYLTTSILFSIFTALIYFNYHQSIMYLSTDREKSSSDFIVAILIGVSFGLSMVFPLCAVFFVGCLIILVLAHKRRLLKPYWRHIGGVILGTLPAPDEERDMRTILDQVTVALSANRNPVLRSWSSAGGWAAWLAGGLMIAIPLVVFFLTNFPGRHDLQWLSDPLARNALPLHLVLSAGVTLFLYNLLRQATATMPSGEGQGGTNLDTALDAVLVTVQNAARRPAATRT